MVLRKMWLLFCSSLLKLPTIFPFSIINIWSHNSLTISSICVLINTVTPCCFNSSTTSFKVHDYQEYCGAAAVSGRRWNRTYAGKNSGSKESICLCAGGSGNVRRADRASSISNITTSPSDIIYIQVLWHKKFHRTRKHHIPTVLLF